MIAMDDADLLEQSSTSPEQEGPGFCGEVRATLKWMLHTKGGRKAPATFAWSDAAGWQTTKKEREALEDSPGAAPTALGARPQLAQLTLG